MNHAPWTDIGSLQSDIRQLQNDIRSKPDNHEIHTLERRLDSLEHACRENRSEIDGILSRMQEMEIRVQQIELDQHHP